jgi:hypothetical protein
MRGKVARELRKAVYGTGAYRDRTYTMNERGVIEADPRRRHYQFGKMLRNCRSNNLSTFKGRFTGPKLSWLRERAAERKLAVKRVRYDRAVRKQYEGKGSYSIPRPMRAAIQQVMAQRNALFFSRLSRLFGGS